MLNENIEAVIAAIREIEPGTWLDLPRRIPECAIPLDDPLTKQMRYPENFAQWLADQLGRNEFEVTWLEKSEHFKVYRHKTSEPRCVLDIEPIGRMCPLPKGAPAALANANWALVEWDDDTTTCVDVGSDLYDEAMGCLLDGRTVHKFGYPF